MDEVFIIHNKMERYPAYLLAEYHKQINNAYYNINMCSRF